MHNQTNDTEEKEEGSQPVENTDTEQDVKTQIAVAQKDQDTSTESDGHGSRWTDGDEVQFIRVRFPGNAKSFPFLYGKRNFQYGQKVVAMSDRGMTVGYINSFPYTIPFKSNMLPIKSIVRGATADDISEQKSHLEHEKRTEVLSNRYISELKLDMNITHVEIIQFGKKAVIYFTAPARVDFRVLVKKLVGDLKMRVELRQISVRDRSAAIGAIGACGLLTCCSGFLKNYGHVSIKLAKLQNLALIPSKINGVCGQLKCCISYEENVYAEKKKKLPIEGKYIQLVNGDKGKITKIHILIEQFEMLTDQGKFRRYAISQYDKNISLPKEWKFPDRFDHIVNETSKIIGLEIQIDATKVPKSTGYEFENIPTEKVTDPKPTSPSTNKTNKRPNNRNKNRNTKRPGPNPRKNTQNTRPTSNKDDRKDS